MMRGIDSRNEIDPSLLLRDTRTIGQRLGDLFADPTNVSIILLLLDFIGLETTFPILNT